MKPHSPNQRDRQTQVPKRVVQCHAAGSAVTKIILLYQSTIGWPGTNAAGVPFDSRGRNHRRLRMPILLWLLGVPISVILLLMLFGVISF
jgi:hypothetical protein